MSYVREFIEYAQHKMKEEVQRNSDSLGINGAASDWPDYRFRVGKLKGIDWASDRLSEYAKQFLNEEEDDD